jgi:(R,R)-butanediol dehydrogenase/meso-butanediol dehydrogenase/diacetyl reductase
MRAAVYYGTEDLRVEDVPDPAPRPGELLLEIHATGICGTDAAEYRFGPFQYPLRQRHPVTRHVGPLIPGHEVAGRVVAVGTGVSGFREGDVVASGGGISCGTCAQCARGKTNLCERYATVGLQRNGGLAQFCSVPAATCFSVEPFGLPEDTAPLAQPMSIAVHSMRQGNPEAGQWALVIGAGGIGAFLIYALAELGAQVAVVDLQAERLATAKALGAADTIQPDGTTPLAELLRERRISPLVVYEVTGARSALDDAFASVRNGGRIVAIGLHDEPRAIDFRSLTLREIVVSGTMAHVCGADMPESLRLLGSRAEGWADVAPIALPLDRLVADGLMPMVEGRASQVKTLVDPWATGIRSAVH